LHLSILFFLCFIASLTAQQTVTAQWEPVEVSDEIRAAIVAAGPGVKVIIPDAGAPWLVSATDRPQKSAILLNQADMTFKMAAGAEIRALLGNGHFLDRGSKLISIDADGVAIVGKGSGATLRMNRNLYSTPPYQISPFRYAVRISGKDNITIRNITIRFPAKMVLRSVHRVRLVWPISMVHIPERPGEVKESVINVVVERKPLIHFGS